MARNARGDGILGGELLVLALITTGLSAQVYPQQQRQRVPVVGGVPRVDVPADAKPNPGTMPDASKVPTVAPGEPPEEDVGQTQRSYTFNPLQAKKEIAAGDFYRKQGKTTAALNRYFEATQWDDSNAEAFYKLGEMREKLKDYAEARVAFAKYVKLNTDPKEAASIQKRIAKYPAASPTASKTFPMTDKLVVLSTCASQAEAEKIAHHLVEKQLAACVNIVPGVRSIYRWQGKVEDAAEVLLVIKTSQNLFAELRDELAAVHSYDVPEVIAMPVVEGSGAYLSWLGEQLKS